MKSKFLFLMLFIASFGFSQSVNDYKAVVIPMKYDFQKTENQYRLQTITKIDLQRAGFQAFYANEAIPAEFQDRRSLLYVEVKKENAFLVTKLYIIFKDCYGAIVFQTATAKSREKEFETAYSEALNEAFKPVYALNYKYNGNTNFSPKTGITAQSLPLIESPTVVAPTSTAPAVAVIPAAAAVTVPVVAIPTSNNAGTSSNNMASGLLYAQPTSYGYQLIDSEPKVVMKVYKTSNPASFMATKGSVQGALVTKDNQWFFEYYQNDKLISEKIDVKF